MSEIAPFAVRDREVTHVIVEIFGGDNNLSPFILEDMQEMAAGNRGPFAVLALADHADRGGVVVELSPRAGNRVLEDLGDINTGDPETLVGAADGGPGGAGDAPRRHQRRCVDQH